MDDDGEGRVGAAWWSAEPTSLSLMWAGGSRGPPCGRAEIGPALSMACGHLKSQQKSLSKPKCMQTARLAQGPGSLCSVPVTPWVGPEAMTSSIRDYWVQACLPDKMQGRLRGIYD